MSNISLATLNDHSLQAIFNHVAAHLLQQGEPSKRGGGRCAYRGDDGTSCAVGCLISDEEYNPVWEGQTVICLQRDPEEYESSLFEGIRGGRAGLLTQLQKIHDSHLPEDWPERLGELAAEYSLTREVLDE